MATPCMHINTAAAITTKHLSFTYASENQAALHDISLTIPAGSCFGLLGPNGAGKSTLLALLTGILPLQQGSIAINGTPAPADFRTHIALVPQDYAFYAHLTVRENLQYFAALYGLRQQEQQMRVDSAIHIGGLHEVLNKPAARCSGGVRRRLNLAIGLLNQPKILFLDEPTVGIDAQSRHFILESIRELQKTGMTIVYTSHYMEEIQSICDTLAIIDHGRLLLQDTLTNILSKAAATTKPAALQHAQTLEEFYLSLTCTTLRD